MFTGIVEEIGSIKGISRGERSIKLTVGCEIIMGDMSIGDSISVNGICLTVTEKGPNWFTADVMPETMRKTNLEGLSINSQVNIERALKASGRFGGHIVSGHIDGTGVISDIKKEDNAIWISIEAPENILKYIVMKGSVAIDGTSLTIAYIDDSCFKVSLIPLTTRETVLGQRKIGDKVNIECDVVGKYIEKFLYINKEDRGAKKDISIDFLRDNGFA